MLGQIQPLQDFAGDADTLSLGLRVKDAADVFYDLLDVERYRYEREYTVSHLLQVQQVLNKRLQQDELTHHELAVLGGLWNLLDW